MISLGSSALRIFVALEPCDMRKGFDGLLAAALAHVEGERLGTDALFVFTNKRRNRVKLLHFDGTGLWVAAKRHATQCPFWIVPESPLSVPPAFRSGD